MGIRILQSCRSYLDRAYRERLGYSVEEASSSTESRNPVWRTVAAADFTSDGATVAEAAGLLLDPEVGILLYLVPFLENTRVSAHVNRALRIRSQLSVERNYSATPVADSDPFGAWRVSICWLVPPETGKRRWLEQVIELRKRTMFSEEVSLDAVFLTTGNEEKALESHGFPCLLMTARQILQKKEMGDVTQWLRADKAVRAALKDFAAGFESTAQKALAAEVVKESERTGDPLPGVPAVAASVGPVELRELRILNFRNLSDVHLNFGNDPVGASIIHGPNGTGKTSVCEALSIALFGSSYRFNRFADRDREKDVTTMNRSAEYIADYLTGIETRNIEPRLGLNGATPERVRLVCSDKLLESELAMSGTILTQDTSLEFARMQADELGARLLRNYSEVAERLESYTEERYERANSARQSYLRGLNLSAAITLLDTAYAKIASRELSRLVSPSLDAHTGWLNQLLGFQWKSMPRDLASQWEDWISDPRRTSVAEAIAQRRVAGAVRKEIGWWLESYNKLVGRSNELARSIALSVEEYSGELADADTKLRVLIEWRATRVQSGTAPAPAEANETKQKLGNLQKQQQKIAEAGQNVRTHLEHLTQVEAFIVQTWSKLHPDDCPTCGVNHAEQGGMLNVVRGLKAKATGDRDRLRDEFARTKEQIEVAQKKLSTFGQTQCPLSNEELSRLASAVQWLLPEGATMDSCLDDEVLRVKLLGLLVCVQSVPPLPQSLDADEQAQRVTTTILAQYKEAEAIFEAPDNWKPVKTKLTETLARVLREHLPGTLAGLWVELAMNLTAAAWVLPDRPSIQVVTHRGEKKSTLRMNGRLVRYILNQSEIHVLGLAWFFSRYLTHGRFHHACLVLDDPAQEMDQTTYREFCRLLETWSRLHRVYERPLKLVILMNQENRALDVARATGGVTHLLGWVPEQKNSVSTLNVLAPGFFAPRPSRLFAMATRG